MDPNIDLRGFRRECIDAEKVFDFVIARATGTELLDLTITSGPDAQEICDILDAGGSLRNIETMIDFEELANENGKGKGKGKGKGNGNGNTGCTTEVVGTETITLPDGEEIELQVVDITKEDIPLIVTFDVFNAAGELVAMDVEATTELPADSICEEPVLLCCPDDGTISCRVLPTSTFRVLDVICEGGKGKGKGGEAPITLRYLFTICQEVQCSSPVKLEVFARPCSPRDLIPLADCNPAAVMNPCRRIFPVRSDDDNDKDW